MIDDVVHGYMDQVSGVRGWGSGKIETETRDLIPAN